MDAELPAPVRLWDQPMAPNPRRLRLYLGEKGLQIPSEAVDLMAGEHKTQAYLSRVGAAQVPALELSDGTVLTETVAIWDYLDALHPEPNLTGRDPLERAVVTMWQRRMEFGLFSAAAHTFRHTNPRMAVLQTQVPDWGALNRAQIAGHLAALDARLAESGGRDWIAADRMTVADVTAYMAVEFLRVLRHPVPETLGALAGWRARVAARPSAKAMEIR